MPYKVGQRDRHFTLPPAVEDWVSVDHPVRFVWAFVQSLDLAKLGIADQPAQRGTSAYPPRELLACWIYGFMDGRRSSRALEKACRETLPYLWLMGLLHPDHVTLWRFYQRHQEGMSDLFKRTVRSAIAAGLVDFALQAIDGTKITVASRSSLHHEETLNKALAELDAAIDAEVAQIQRQEDPPTPSDESLDEPPLTPPAGTVEAPTVESAVPLSEASEHAPQPQGEDAPEPTPEPPADTPPQSPTGDRRRLAKLQARRQRVQEAIDHIAAEKAAHPERQDAPTACVTDPDAVLLKTRQGWQVGYNAQIVVDQRSQIIVAADVSTQGYDQQQLIPLLEQEHALLGRYPETMLSDNGYFSAANLAYAQGRTDLYVPDKSYERSLTRNTGLYHRNQFVYDAARDVYVCPAGQVLPFARTSKRSAQRVRQYQGQNCADCPQREACTRSARGRIINRSEQENLLQAHREKTMTEEAKTLMKQRHPLVEGPFGILKDQQGARRFLHRSLEAVQHEWQLLCAAFNLRKLYQVWRQGLAQAGAAAQTLIFLCVVALHLLSIRLACARRSLLGGV